MSVCLRAVSDPLVATLVVLFTAIGKSALEETIFHAHPELNHKVHNFTPLFLPETELRGVIADDAQTFFFFIVYGMREQLDGGGLGHFHVGARCYDTVAVQRP